MPFMYNLLADYMDFAQFPAYVITSVVLIILMFVAALAAVILVLLQQSNSEGIQGITASSETFFGKNKGQSVESKLKKWTWISLVVLGVLSIVFFIIQIVVPH